MEHLDNFLREQFQQDDPTGRFPFREENWEQALLLIEAAERKRRRRGLLWWWFAGLLLLAGGWWVGRQIRQSTTSDRSVSRQELPAGAGSPTTALPNSDAVKSEETTFNTSIGAPATAQKEQSIQNFNANKNEPTVTVGRAGKNQSSENRKSGTVKKRALSEVAPAANAVLPNAQASHAGSSPALAKQTNVELVDNPPVQMDTLLVANSIRPAQGLNWQNMERLPVDFLPLIAEPDKFTLARVPYTFPVIQPVPEPRFALGLNASATFYQPAPAGRHWGATVGGYAEYWLRPSWSITAGLAWRNQAIDQRYVDSSMVSAHQLRYRFGYEEETYQREDRRLRFIEIPLALHWHYHAWQLEAGATFGQLMAVRAVETHTTRSSLAPTPEVTERNIQGQIDPYRRNYAAAFLGLGWQPLRRLQLEIRGTYRPASLLRPSLETTAPTGGFWLDAGLRWQLFSNDRIRVRR